MTKKIVFVISKCDGKHCNGKGTKVPLKGKCLKCLAAEAREKDK